MGESESVDVDMEVVNDLTEKPNKGSRKPGNVEDNVKKLREWR